LVTAPRAAKNGRRSACRAGDHHGEGWPIPLTGRPPQRDTTGQHGPSHSTVSGNRQTPLTLFDFLRETTADPFKPRPTSALDRLFMSKDAFLVHSNDDWFETDPTSIGMSRDAAGQMLIIADQPTPTAKGWHWEGKSVCCSPKPLRWPRDNPCPDRSRA
jgi:hypothetical protein